MKRACCGAQKMTPPVESNQFCNLFRRTPILPKTAWVPDFWRASPCPGAWGYVLPQVLTETNPEAHCSEAALTLRRHSAWCQLALALAGFALTPETNWEREAHRCRLESVADGPAASVVSAKMYTHYEY
jgi:hypothetical protein